MKDKLKKLLKIAGIILGVILLAALVYVSYVFLSYSRIEDNFVLTSDSMGSDIKEEVKLDEEYLIYTYNIGFGAYEDDYSFFMDGGKSSWAKSRDGLIENIYSIGELTKEFNPDFVVMQEVDTNGTRTYHVNEYESLKKQLGYKSNIFALNYHSAFLFYPFNEPHGANKSGLFTASDFKVDNAIRRSLPISTSLSKITDLDRCYSITRYPTENGKLLCIYNVHLSAYTSDMSVREGQLKLLFGDMDNDFKAGNYVICGGDFNHNLRVEASSDAPVWAQIFPREKLPEGFNMAFDNLDADISHDSCRNADKPYDPNDALTVMIDGFIISSNIEPTYYENINRGYKYSDHDPVVMRFILH